jgi:hypothetical protein
MMAKINQPPYHSVLVVVVKPMEGVYGMIRNGSMAMKFFVLPFYYLS